METNTMLKTRQVQTLVDELTHFLADTYSLYILTQNFHWNVTGAEFYSLHKLFDEQYQELAAAIDEIAERIRAIGSFVPASLHQFSRLSSFKDEKTELNAEAMLKTLAHNHEIIARHAANLVKTAQQANDEGTADLLIQRLKIHEKSAWMLNSSLRT